MSMEKSEHRQSTLSFFRKAALEKQGFYDASGDGDLRHNVWQRRVRSHLESRILSLSSSSSTILDVGCGNGDFIFELAAKMPDMTFRGHDFSAEMIEVAKKKYGNLPNLSYQTQDLLSPDTEVGRYDIVLCLNMFHHLHFDDLDRGMDALAGLTRRSLLFEIKNADNFWNRRFRPTDSFPVNLLAPRRAREYLAKRGLQFVGQWNIFLFEPLSPIVILEFSRDAGANS